MVFYVKYSQTTEHEACLVMSRKKFPENNKIIKSINSTIDDVLVKR